MFHSFASMASRADFSSGGCASRAAGTIINVSNVQNLDCDSVTLRTSNILKRGSDFQRLGLKLPLHGSNFRALCQKRISVHNDYILNLSAFINVEDELD